MANPPQFPDVTVRLIGQDGNVFNLIGLTARALRRAGHSQAAATFEKAAFRSGSYDAVLRLITATVKVK